ncbi:MAG: MBOAT family protein [Phycisphaerae bacterium]
MYFHTWTFVVFIAVFYPVFLLVRKTPLRDWWLLGASYVFYGWWNPIYLVLIAYSTAIDYYGVVMMARAPTVRRKKLWLALSIGNNLLLLGFFKYGAFVAQSLTDLLGYLGLPYMVPEPNWQPLVEALNGLFIWTGLPWRIASLAWLLPAGISFYTFVSMSYAIDFYRGHIKPEPSFIRYATFVALFPHLVAGPIMRAADLLPQLQSCRRITRQGVTDGLSLFVMGLFKKLALADYLALYVNHVYGAKGDVGVPGQFTGPALILATVAFGWQIYFDFSGYTDMARGIGRIMGYEFMQNFNHPYLATGLGDFWQRWHISLSTWFRDYVYIPLGGNRKGEVRTYVNMCLTMLISGLWHGAAWTFVIWGALHALGRVLTRHLERQYFWAVSTPRIVKQVLVFAFVTFAWIFFRSQSLSDAWLVVSRIFTTTWADPGLPLLAAGLVAMVWAYQFLIESRLKPVLQAAPVRVALMSAMIVYLAFIPGSQAQQFIYFQF